MVQGSPQGCPSGFAPASTDDAPPLGAKSFWEKLSKFR
jgi:hypothetical protein